MLPDRRWLDVGCGTGALSEAILRQASPVAVKGIDRSDDYIAYVRAHVRDGRAQFAISDAQALSLDGETYDAVVSGLVLNFVPEPGRMIAEMVAAATRDGVVAVYVWDYAGKMELMRHFWDAAAALDATAQELDEGRRFPICQPDRLRELFESAGLRRVAVQPVEAATDFRDFDDYWLPFLGGQGPAPGYARSLSDEARAAFREQIRAGLRFEPEGSLRMVARAWAVRGYRQ
jgi:SAM-dependent methyltransferase